MSSVSKTFRECVRAIREDEHIVRAAPRDKEHHFQEWFKARLSKTGEHFDEQGRNSYPDFIMAQFAEGYEVKGLAYPGREKNYDCNSHLPYGTYNGRQIFYVFGRYPGNPDGKRYPVLDLVVCHGSFLNADNTYVHKNESFRGFGSYGDILVRDRKMYVAPTPFALVEGAAHHRTLILPADMPVDNDLIKVGDLERREADQMVVAYRFDLTTNKIRLTHAKNPNAGAKHMFRGYRVPDDPNTPIKFQN